MEPSTEAKAPSVLEGEEFIYVLEGRVKVSLADFTDILNPGDTIYYHSTLPHQVECHEQQPALILAMIYSERS